RHDRAQRLSLALLALTLLPALTALRALPSDALVHDRYLYLPSIGFALLVAALLARFTSPQKIFGVSASHFATVTAICVAFVAGSLTQQRVWASNLSLYTR